MNFRGFGVPVTVCSMLVPTPVVSAAAPVSPVSWSGAPRAQSVPVGNDGLATDETDASSGSVAVIPFTNISGNPADDWIGDGIAETVMADLESLAELTVIARERMQAVSDGGRGTELDEGAALALGRELGARWIVTGGYQRLGDQLRITARLVGTQSGLVARTVKVDGRLDEIFGLQDRIATELTTDVRSNARTQATPRESRGRAALAAARGRGGRAGRHRPRRFRGHIRRRWSWARHGDRWHHPARRRPAGPRRTGGTWRTRRAARRCRCAGSRRYGGGGRGRHPRRSPERDRGPRRRDAAD